MKAPHSKCGILARVSGVRIPPSPPFLHSSQLILRGFRKNKPSASHILSRSENALASSPPKRIFLFENSWAADIPARPPSAPFRHICGAAMPMRALHARPSRCVTIEDKVASFDGRVAGKAGDVYHFGGGKLNPVLGGPGTKNWGRQKVLLLLRHTRRLLPNRGRWFSLAGPVPGIRTRT